MVVFQHLESYCVTMRGAFRLLRGGGYFSFTNEVTVRKEQIHFDLLRSFPATWGKAAFLMGPRLPTEHPSRKQLTTGRVDCSLLERLRCAGDWDK